VWVITPVFRSSTRLLVLSAAFAIAFIGIQTLAQDLPKEIRGYRVHRANIAVRTSASTTSNDKEIDPHIHLGEPKLIDVSLTGITFEVSIELGTAPASGTIDFLAFQGFRVNGIPVEIKEYRGPITFKKGESFPMPRPATVFVSNAGVLQAAWSEFKKSQKSWTVTGRVLAFGKFKKMGMEFKRVVPIEVDVSIKNPFIPNKKPAPVPSP
jgi:hypothetical protein